MTANALRLWGYKRLRPAVKAATEGRISGERYTDLDALVAAARASLMFRQSSAAVDADE